MNDNLLSQEEIDALLNKKPDAAPAGKTGPEKSINQLQQQETDALGEIGNIAMGTASTALSMLIGRKVRITTPEVDLTSMENLPRDFPVPHLAVAVEYSMGFEGGNLLVIRRPDAQVIAQLMLGQDPQADVELDELRLSAVTEAMNQMMGSAATSMSTMFSKTISIAPPRVEVVNFAEESPEEKFVEPEPDLVRISFNLTIEDLVDSSLMLLIPLTFAREMVAAILNQTGAGETRQEEEVSPPAQPDAAASPSQAAAPERPPEEVGQQQPAGAVASGPPETAGGPAESPGSSSTSRAQPQPEVQPVHFGPLQGAEEQTEAGNLERLLDIPLEVTVELGRTRRLIKEVLELGVGSLLELEKLAGEPVDILVNGKLIARGEVVVVGENFGVRVTDIVGLQERMKTLQ